MLITHHNHSGGGVRDCLILIPTYNESENIIPLIEQIFILHPKIHILIIDDHSPDGTAQCILESQKLYPNLHLLLREQKEGLAKAYIAGFHWGLNRGYQYFLQMDADFSHHPQYIKDFLNYLQHYDVVIGSRNINGGKVEGWSLLRKAISKGGSWYARSILKVDIQDFTGGFNAYNQKALLRIDLSSLVSNGYCFQIEMKYKAHKSNLSIKEFPIVFRDRSKGKSKMNQKILFEAFYKILKIR